MHNDISLQTYTDFGQNCGRYQAGRVNAMLGAVRKAENGVVLYYSGNLAGQSYTLDHAMPDFSSADDNGTSAAVGLGFTVTVHHNGVLNPTYSGNEVGRDKSVHYTGIEYRNTDTFQLKSGTDYKLIRLSKMVTDVQPTPVYNEPDMLCKPLTGEMVYRTGSGSMVRMEYDADGRLVQKRLTGAYGYRTGGVMEIGAWAQHGTTESDDNYGVFHYVNSWLADGVSDAAPLPYVLLAGDSGSPLWVYNEKAGEYQYIAAAQSTDGISFTQDRGSWSWTHEAMESCNVRPDLSAGTGNLIVINGVHERGEDIHASVDNGHEVTGTPWRGSIETSKGGEVLSTSFVGVQSGVNTWADLSAVKNDAAWWTYGAEYLNASQYGDDPSKPLDYADLYLTNNIVLSAGEAKDYTVRLAETVDTGIGVVQFSKAEGVDHASFTIESAAGQNALFNTAGFSVDAGVTLNIALTNPADYVREWRKAGAGDLHIIGSGNNEVLLNVGGTGTTYLEREGGYAAYNVLASSGSTVVLADIDQVAHDVTLGAGGATLDLNGNNFAWDNSSSAGDFTFHTLTEGGILANHGEGTSVVTITDAGDSYIGSFEDSAKGALQVVYNAGKNWMLNGVFTDMQHHKDSSFTVQSGNVTLQGTNTVHGMGSATGKDTSRLVNTADWHYADAAMDVNVQSGAAFTLGHHARLTGDVTVEAGGSFSMHEGTQSRYEHIEGGLMMQDTEAFADYYGLHGNVQLKGGAMDITYSEGTSSNNRYDGDISGTASSFTIALGTSGASLTLGGKNDFAIAGGAAVQLESGRVVADSAAAAGYTDGAAKHSWHIGEKASLAVKGLSGDALMSLVTADSTGVLALTEAQTTAFSALPTDLIIGAAEGMRVEYGTAGETLASADGRWLLGGGGGELVVNFRLSGDADLVLGNAYTKGSVTLTNTANDFTGHILFEGGVTLDYTDVRALGNADFSVAYSNRVAVSGRLLSQVSADSDGALLLDHYGNEDINLSAHTQLALGTRGHTVYEGTIGVGSGESYRFGGLTGTLELTQALTGDHDIIVNNQSYSGGVLQLDKAVETTGAVSVRGANTAAEGGDVVLRLNAENALASVSSVSLAEGGSIDMAGHTQQINNLSSADMLNSPAVKVYDSVGSGTLVLNATQDSFFGGLVSAAEIEKTGAARSTVRYAEFEHLTVSEGAIRINSDAAGDVTIRSGAALELSGATLTGNVTVTDGSHSVFTNSWGAKNARLLGSLNIEQGGSVAHTGNTLILRSGNQNTLGGTLELSGNATLGFFSAGNNTSQTFGGTLLVSGNATIKSFDNEKNGVEYLSNQEFYTNKHQAIDNLTIQSGSTATLTSANTGVNTIWNIHSLNGSGKLVFDTNYYAQQGMATSQLVLDGKGNFSGVLEMSTPYYSSSRAVAPGSYLVLAHDEALSNARVDLIGYSTTVNHQALAVNTENAHMLGLNSYSSKAGATTNVSSYLFAGAAPETTPARSIAMASTRKATLTLTGDGTYSFNGYVGSAGESANAGLSIVMAGTGSQSFTGTTVVDNVSALRGTLNITTPTVKGDVSIGRGANLQLGSSFSLNAGHTLSVVAGDTAGSASFNSALVLNGGTLAFSGEALAQSADTPALSVSALSFGGAATQTIAFTDTSYLNTDTVYQLVNGDWSSRAGSVSASGLSYLNAAFGTNASGLTVSFTLADGSALWNGTAASHAWDGKRFGAGVTTAVFNDSAEEHEVRVTENVAMNRVVSDTQQEYSFVADGGKASIGSLTHDGSGTTVLGKGAVQVTGETVINRGTLTVQDTAALAGAVSGEGTLAIDWKGESGTVSGLGHIGTLAVQGGRYEAGSTVDAGLIRVTEGGQFLANGGTQTSAMQLAGAGLSSGADAKGALLLRNGATISGAVALADDASVAVSSGQTGTLSGIVTTGEHVLTKDGAGTLNLANRDFSGALHIANGTVALTGGGNYAGFTSIEMEGGTTLNMAGNQINNSEALSLTMRDGARVLLNTASRLHADITVENAAQLCGSTGGNSAQVTGTISGSGTLSLGMNNRNRWYLDSTISDGANGKLALEADESAMYIYVRGNNSYSGGTTIKAGDITTYSERALGTGAVTMKGGSLTLANNLTVNSLEGSAGTVNLNGKALVLDGSDSLSYSGTVTGGSLAMAGSGTQVLNGNVNLTHLLAANGTRELGAATVSDSIRVTEDGTLVLNGMLDFRGTIQNDGRVTLAEGAGFNVDSALLPASGAGSVTLIDGSGFIGGQIGLDRILIGGQSIVGYSAGVSVEQGLSSLNLVYAGFVNRDITWTGAKDGVWNIAETQNWQNDKAQGTGAYRADSVIFGKEGAGAVSIAEGVSAENMTVAAGEYSFTGMDNLTLTGSMQVNKGAVATVDSLANRSTVAVGGTLKLDVARDTTLNTVLTAAEDGTKGTFAKTGSGTLTVGESLSMVVDTLAVEQGTVLLKRNGSSTHSIGTADLHNGANLTVHNASQPTELMKLGAIRLSGESATVQENHFDGALSVGSLQLADGLKSATLKLVNNAASECTTVFELGGGDGGNFRGTIELSSISANHYRSAAVVLNDAKVAQNARINLASTSSADAKLGLGVHADAVTIAGLSSTAELGERASVFSGTAKLATRSGNGIVINDGDKVRTLTVDTAKGTDDTFHGTVGAKLNLVKDGEGKQTFAGESTAFNGKLSVKNGTLALKDNAAKMLAQASDVALNGGTLEVNSAADVTVDKAVSGEGAALEKKGSGTLSFTKSVAVDSLAVSGGAVKVQKGDAAATITALNGQTGTAGKLAMSANEDGSISIVGNGTELNHMMLDLAANTRLNLSDVVFASSSKLTDDTAFVNVNHVTFVAEVGTNTTMQQVMTGPLTLASSVDAGETLSLTAPAPTLSLTLSSVENVQLSGSHLYIDLVGVNEETLAAAQYIKLGLGGEATFATTLDVTLTWNGQSAIGYYEQGNLGAVFFDRSFLCAPEPATTTLGLLALAALAGRRRRK
ncbi:MAG: autotransporter-associated beta strand repeat-containing protein [Akkermansia sp.]|nr:autotransporter-associated beta strand repeat-containing protein [Akkermansia sp.]